MPIQSAGGAMTHFLRAGHGPEDALFLHCMLAEARAWDGVMAKLPTELSMLTMDLPGHGQSEDWDTARDYGEMAAAMAYGLLEQPAHLVGHSFGAYVALRVAVEHPGLVRSLTLFDPVYFYAAQHSDPKAFKAHKREAQKFMGALAVGDTISAARAFTAEWGVGVPWEALKQDQMDYITERMRLVAAGEAAIADDNAGLWDRLPELDIPVALVQGSGSPAIVPAIQDALETQLQNVRRVTLEGAGHMAPLTHAEETAAVIGAFIATQPRSNPIN